jgi:4,5-dihydroxyphthalate decarboxylase
MGRVELSLAINPNWRIGALLDGVVTPEGIDLVISKLSPGDVFWRQLKFGEFDVSEMSLSSLLIATAKGDRRWKALPIFPDRRFFHTFSVVRARSDIRRPQDLKGKRVGVPDYQMTAALWTRGALQHEFGVKPSEMEWYMERTPEKSHGGATGFEPPPGVKLQYIPPDKSINSMILSDELDAALVYVPALLTVDSMIDRSKTFLGEDRARWLFPDQDAERARYYSKLGFIPMNHTLVVRAEILERYPWVALNLFKAFVEAKEVARAHLRELLAPHRQMGVVTKEVAAGLETDPFPYGVRANERALALLAEYSLEQGLTPRLVRREEIFPASVLDL